MISTVVRDDLSASLNFATVRDYCDSADRFPDLARHQYDLKDVQRPWAVKSILRLLPPGSRLLEIGSGEPLAAARLAAAGYDVTVCDPLDGLARGPENFAEIQRNYPQVRIIRELFLPDVAKTLGPNYDCIFSISVLEHVPQDALAHVFEAVAMALAPGGHSLHAIDHILEGTGREHHEQMLLGVMQQQDKLAGHDRTPQERAHELEDLLSRARHDLETYYLSALGHHLWRGGLAYDEFPFRKCISVQSLVRRPA